MPFSISHIVALSMLLSACVTADVGEGEDPGLGEIDYQVDNGIFLPNGMNLGNGSALALGYRLHGSPAATFNGTQVIVAQAVLWPGAA